MENSPPERKLVILGAGVCGLYAGLTALRKGWKVTILERAPQPGGLAAGFKLGENHYDLGVHMLHAFDREIFDDISTLMGPERIEVQLDARIRWGERSYRYPLKGTDLIQGMPPLRLLKCISGLVLAELRRAIGPSDPANAEDTLIDFYGAPLYEFFFEDFTHRYWGIHPRDLSPEFIRRKMPRLSAVDVVRNMIARFIPAAARGKLTTDSPLNSETLHYSSKGAAGMIAALTSAIGELGGEIILNCQPTRVTLTPEKGICFEQNESAPPLAFDQILSTIPIPALTSILSGIPEEIQTAAAKLRYKPIAIQGLLVSRTKAMEGLYTYFRNRVFHRVGEPKNAGLRTIPGSSTILIVEMTCEHGDAKWHSHPETRRKIIRDLEAEGICKESEILEWHPLNYAEGYPIYDLGFEKNLSEFNTWLTTQPDLLSTGRQGAFTYPAMHNAMRMGADAIRSFQGLTGQ